MKRVPLSFTKEDAADRWMNIHLLASSMNQNLELEASLGKKKANWFGFLEIKSGLEIIDPFCDPRDSEKNPISYSPSAVLIEFQSAVKAHFVKCSPGPVTWDKVNWQPWSESWFEDSDLKIHSTEKGVLVADTEVEWIIPLGNSKSRVWHRSKGKATRNSKVERKRAVPNEGPNLKGQASRCPSVKSRGLVSAESCLFSF